MTLAPHQPRTTSRRRPRAAARASRRACLLALAGALACGQSGQDGLPVSSDGGSSAAGASGTGAGRAAASAGRAAGGSLGDPVAGARAGGGGGGARAEAGSTARDAGTGLDDDAGANGSAGAPSSAGTGAAADGGAPSATGTPAERAARHGKFAGNITTSGKVRGDFAQYWNQLTPENEGKWGSVERTRDVMDWTALDAAHAYASMHGLAFKQHTFVWGQQAPGWLSGLAPAEQAAEVEEWIRLFCERYPDVAMIDVVNEPDHATPSFIGALGGAGASGHDWVLWAFRAAREHCPNAILILNDYNVLRWDTDKFLAIARKVQAAGLLDAIGAQSHGLETQPIAELTANLAKLVALGVPIYISEYDVNLADDAQQRAVMAEQFTLFWTTPEIVGVTLWGYVYGATWKPETGLLRNDVPRPALTWLMDYLGR